MFAHIVGVPAAVDENVPREDGGMKTPSVSGQKGE